MKKSLFLFTLSILAFGGGVYAAPSGKTDMEERIKLSKDLHDIRNIRERINMTIQEAANAVPPVDREDFQKYVQLHVDYNTLEQKSIQYAAEVYTAPELKAMIAYFGSADGQSAEAKGEEFGSKIAKDIFAEIDKAITAAKYDGVPETSLPQTPGKMRGPNVSPDMLDRPAN